MKTCQICKEQKPESEYGKRSDTKDGLHYQCKVCNRKKSSQYLQTYRLENPPQKRGKKKTHTKEQILANRKEWNNKRKQDPEYRKRLNKQTYKWKCERFKIDPVYKLQKSIRDSLYRHLKFNRKTPYDTIIGCTWDELKQHIESQFQDGMTWDNWSKDGWHIDHIIPLISASNENELYLLNHYTNLQPLWAPDNLSKGGRI
jgi:hypothetical protein